jgi:hypothetical protein
MEHRGNRAQFLTEINIEDPVVFGIQEKAS